MLKTKLFRHISLASILSGILIGTSYIPFPPWAYLFCFVPLWKSWFESQSAKEIFIKGWATQFVLTLIGFNWITFTVHEFGGLPWPLAFVVLIGFCSIANLDLPLTGLVWWWMRKKWPTTERRDLFRLAILAAIFEAWIPTLFPWNYGYPWLWINWPIAQNAELIGFQGLSSLIILLNVGTFLGYRSWQTRQPGMSVIAVFRPVLWVLTFFIALNVSGWLLKKSAPKPDAQFTAAITQANIGNQMKVRSEQGMEFREYIMERYYSLTEAELKNGPVDVILWPETAIPYDFNFNRGLSYYIHGLIDKTKVWDATLILGGYGFSDNIDFVTNSIFVVDPETGIDSKYYFKTTLLAFGEYIPGGETFPQFYNWIPAGRFRRGPGPHVYPVRAATDTINAGMQICYESLFPYFSKGLADQNAEVIFNVTNDSWYGTWQEPYQHLYMTAGRAVEFRRPLVRSTNTGISAFVTALGEVMNPSPQAVEWTGRYKVEYKKNPQPTFYQRIPWLIDVLLLSLLMWTIWKRTPSLKT